jgi:hypothetical protein
MCSNKNFKMSSDSSDESSTIRFVNLLYCMSALIPNRFGEGDNILSVDKQRLESCDRMRPDDWAVGET